VVSSTQILRATYHLQLPRVVPAHAAGRAEPAP